ncbi:MAG: deoxyguanosinetriphosphate triphosphohydrolase [Candidatus Aadella gelida]|nr:deoxyguanosinetriphosphate triphosphohydrolase [Candidatus Aadella gelida]
MIYRNEIEKKENLILASYAMKSSNTRGRQYDEEEHPYRSAYQRDKDRIVYSTAFRRLEYKTQVFVNHEGDYYRTRLTHTLEVAQIARTIARTLKLNEDLVEAIALAHDLGHTPFGHSGEDTLAKLMKDHGGFDHNTHGLRVVDKLEKRYPKFCGLNLSEEVRRGIIRHSTPFDQKRMGDQNVPGPNLLEIQVVNIADEIAYDNHDLDDGLKSGLLSGKDLAGTAMWDEAVLFNEKNSPPDIDKSTGRAQIVRYLINKQVSDIIDTSFKRIEEFGIREVEDIDKIEENVIAFSGELNTKRIEFKKNLEEKLYKHYRVIKMSKKASRFLTSLFGEYLNNPEQLPPQYLERVKGEDKFRVICDYMAGMTDRYALDQYKMFFEPYERV